MCYVLRGIANTHQLCGLQSTVPESAASVSPGNLLEMHIPGPSPDQLSQKLWGLGQQSWFYPGDSDAFKNLSTVGPAVHQTSFLFFLSRELDRPHFPDTLDVANGIWTKTMFIISWLGP